MDHSSSTQWGTSQDRTMSQCKKVEKEGTLKRRAEPGNTKASFTSGQGHCPQKEDRRITAVTKHEVQGPGLCRWPGGCQPCPEKLWVCKQAFQLDTTQ